MLSPEDASATPNMEDVTNRSHEAFEFVFANGHKLEIDHYLVYHSRPCSLHLLYKLESSFSSSLRLRTCSLASTARQC